MERSKRLVGMNDITIAACILASITVLIAWMLKTGTSFADLDAWWNWQFDKFGAWFMRMASSWDVSTARKTEVAKNYQPGGRARKARQQADKEAPRRTENS